MATLIIGVALNVIADLGVAELQSNNWLVSHTPTSRCLVVNQVDGTITDRDTYHIIGKAHSMLVVDSPQRIADAQAEIKDQGMSAVLVQQLIYRLTCEKGYGITIESPDEDCYAVIVHCDRVNREFTGTTLLNAFNAAWSGLQ